jgi:hypothetical protein
MNLKNGLLAGAFALLAVVAAVGWSKVERGSNPAVSPLADGQVVGYNSSANPTAGNATGATNVGYTSSPTCADANGSGYRTAEYYPDDRYVQSIHRPVVVRQYQQPQPVYAATYATTEVREHHHRSKKKSLAIIAGSAGTGAAIGAIAGGGRGAGIGALAGGAGGFIYDRLTHNR